MTNYTVGYNHTLTPNLVNDLRFGKQHFSTATLTYFYVNNRATAGTELGIPGFNGDSNFNNPGIPDFGVSGFSGWGNAGANWFQDDATWQGTEQISWSHGAHNIMAGAEFRKLITERAAIIDICIKNAIIAAKPTPMPRLKGSADLLEDRRQRALALLKAGLTSFTSRTSAKRKSVSFSAI